MADFHLKIEWAYKHIEELHVALDSFIATEPYVVSEKQDAETGEHLYYVARVTPVPFNILLIAGDIFQNLRSSLDYLACDLVKANAGTPDKGTGFPILENVPTTTEQKATFARKVKGMRQEVIDIIQRIEPYKGRNERLWRLHELNIRDKHRLLLTAGAAVWRFNFGQHMRATHDGLLSTANDFWIGPRQALLVEEGQILKTDPPDAKVNENIEFGFQIAFNEIGVCVGEPLITVVRQSLNTIRGLLPNFEPFL